MNSLGIKKLKAVKVAVITSLSLSCGAPTKSAEEVSSIFAHTQQLGASYNSFCRDLIARQNKPTLKNITQTGDTCGSAGAYAQNLNGLQEIQFAGLDMKKIQEANASGQPVTRLSVRTQLWLNKSILGLASMLGSALARGAASANNQAGTTIENPNQTTIGTDSLVQSQIKSLRPLKFDKESKQFDTAISLSITGVAKVYQEVDLVGQIIGNNIAISVDSNADQPFERSIFKNMKIAIMIVPHASDVYLEVLMDLDIHSIGVDSLIAAQLKTALTTLFKKGIDSLLSAG